MTSKPFDLAPGGPNISLVEAKQAKMTKSSLTHSVTLRLPGMHYRVELWTRDQDTTEQLGAAENVPVGPVPSAADAPAPPETPPETPTRLASTSPASPRASNPPTTSTEHTPTAPAPRRRDREADGDTMPPPKSRRVS